MPSNRTPIRQKRSCGLYLLYIVTIVTLANAFSTTAVSKCIYQANCSQNKSDIIIREISKCGIADLAELFDGDTALTSEIIINIISYITLNVKYNVKLKQTGITIKNALITDNLNLNNLIFDFDIVFYKCNFDANLNFSQSIFSKSLTFQKCFFRELCLHSATINYNLEILDCILCPPSDFGSIRVDGQLIIKECHFLSDTSNSIQYTSSINHNQQRNDLDCPLDTKEYVNSNIVYNFYNIQIKNKAVFSNTIFGEPVILSGAQIAGILQLDGAIFKKEADFYLMRVSEQAIFNNATFFRFAEFSGMNIGGALLASDISFWGNAIFEKMAVGGDAYFNKAWFYRRVSFSGAKIGGSFQPGDGACFFNEANFTAMSVSNHLILDNALFIGPALFSRAFIGNVLQVDEATFLKDAIFENIHLDGDFWMSGTNYYAHFSCTGAHIKGVVYASDTKFQETVNFNSSKIHTISIFINYDINKKIYLRDCNISYLSIKGRKGNYISSIDLSRSILKSSLEIGLIQVSKLLLYNTTIAGECKFFSMKIKNEANLGYSVFQRLIIDNVIWPINKSKNNNFFSVRGMSFGDISIESNNHRLYNQKDLLLSLLSKTDFDEKIYSDLESYFARQGHADWADEVYIERKETERKKNLKQYSWDWVKNYFLDITLKYGRRPSRVPIFMFFMLLVGIIAFKKSAMQPKSNGNFPKNYSSIWYSLDLLIPFIDLHSANLVVPKEDRRKTYVYMRIHIICGWISVSIGLAWILGILK